MKKSMRIYQGSAPAELEALLKQTRPLAEVKAKLARERISLDDDPDFVADCLKADIVEELLRALQKREMNQNQLADRLGKSRQWVSHILNERDNFTVATLARLACAVEMRPFITFTQRDEMIHVIPCRLAPVAIEEINCLKDWEAINPGGVEGLVNPPDQNEEDAVYA